VQHALDAERQPALGQVEPAPVGGCGYERLDLLESRRGVYAVCRQQVVERPAAIEVDRQQQVAEAGREPTADRRRSIRTASSPADSPSRRATLSGGMARRATSTLLLSDRPEAVIACARL
jgi:hypothetical protein